jgi:hypothetical protein
MDRDTARDVWHEYRERGRIAPLREHRAGLNDLLDVSDPIPEGNAAIEAWADRYASTVTKQLSADSESEGNDE